MARVVQHVSEYFSKNCRKAGANGPHVIDAMSTRATFSIRPTAPADLPWLVATFTRRFGGPEIDSHDEWFDTRRLPGFVAERDGTPIAALSHTVMNAGGECEVVALASAVERIGAGTALLEACLSPPAPPDGRACP